MVVHDLVGFPAEVIESQIRVLNEDFGAIPETPGENSVDTNIRFKLVAIDEVSVPAGVDWTDDPNVNAPCAYCDTLAWDPQRYLNIYINSMNPDGDGFIQGAAATTQWELVGTTSDRVVISPQYVGNPSSNFTYTTLDDTGRTGTHEVGHYMGLYHVYQPVAGCQGEEFPACYSGGDLVCDTLVQRLPTLNQFYPFDQFAESCPVCTEFLGCVGGCPSGIKPDNSLNYMDKNYSACLEYFTSEQAMRARCVIANWRPELPVADTLAPDVTITSPMNGQRFGDNVTISFSGDANDDWDAEEVRGSLMWYSDKVKQQGGLIGSGRSFSTSLPAGNHHITAIATDTAGNTGIAAIDITVFTPRPCRGPKCGR